MTTRGTLYITTIIIHCIIIIIIIELEDLNVNNCLSCIGTQADEIANTVDIGVQCNLLQSDTVSEEDSEPEADRSDENYTIEQDYAAEDIYSNER